ncbi:DUF4349 domain-containing protein [Candidatus Woesearchaeota archaeon]|nr:DUF4349 domain-containing protein [Candidatus Woesearchaeota archaeon]
MAIKEQLVKIKENWLMLALVLLVIIFLKGGSIPMLSTGIASEKFMAADASYSRAGYGFLPPVPINEDFAPDVQDRKITKSSSMSVETPTGGFSDAESKLKSVVRSSGSYLLNENVNKYESGWKSYYTGSYQIKVDTKKYNDVVAQLKGIGEVKSFNENAEDVTGSYKNLEIEINAEKQRLLRYTKMYEEATLVADKLQLSDRIFEQERTIKYLEDSLKNIDQRIEYSTIYITLNEKQPGYANIKFVKFSELVRSLVASLNSLLKLIFVAMPYAAAALIAWIAVRLFRKKQKK